MKNPLALSPELRARLGTIFAMALPIMVQNLVQHLQMVIDRAFLGNLDPVYLAAIGNVMTPYNAVGLFLVASSTGLTVLVAQNIGAKKLQEARDLSESSFVFTSVLSTLMFLFWLVGAEGIFTLLGAQGDIKEAASVYVRIMAVSLIFTGADVTAASVLQGAGFNLPIMVTGLLKNLLNILFDWLLIYGVGPFPALGLQGAAVATVISNVVGSLVLVLWTLRYKKLPFRFSLRALLKPRWVHFAKTMALGLPSGVESVLWFVGQLFLLRMINQINPLAAGIVSLVQGISLLALFVYLGFARAATTLVGQAWGARDSQQARKAALTCQNLGLGVSLVWTVVMLAFPEALCSLFTQDPQMVADSVPMLRLSAVFINFQAVNVIIGHSIRGTGDTKWMLYSQIFGTLFVIGASWVLIFPLNFGLAGLFITLILDEAGRGLVNYLKFLKASKPILQEAAA